MATKVGELFVNLEIKGADKSVKSIVSVKEGLGQAKEMGLALAAAIGAAFYGLEKFTGAAGARGMELTKFANYTGLSTEKLQKMQVAMEETGVSAGETQQAITELQDKLQKQALGQGDIAGMKRLTEVVAIDPSKRNDVFYMIEQLKKYMQLEKDVTKRNQVMSSFFGNQNFVQGLRVSKDFSKVSGKEILNPKEISNLAEMNRQWIMLQHHMEVAGQKFLGSHGKEIAQMIHAISQLVDGLLKLADALKVFKGLSKIFEGWNLLIGGTSRAVDAINKNKGGPIAGLKQQGKEAAEGLGLAAKGAWISLQESLHAPKVAPINGAQNKPTGENNVNVTVNQNGVENTHSSVKDFTSHIKSALTKINTFAQGN